VLLPAIALPKRLQHAAGYSLLYSKRKSASVDKSVHGALKAGPEGCPAKGCFLLDQRMAAVGPPGTN
jgi:hypothetical protein